MLPPLLRRAIKLATVLGLALLLRSSDVRASTSIDSDNNEDEIQDAPVCSSAEQKACVNDAKHGDDNSISYETPDVEFCRRRPTWTARQQEIEEESKKNVGEKCQRILGYKPDIDMLAQEDDEDDDDDDDDDDGPTPGNNQDLPVLERPLFRNVARCMEDNIAATASETVGDMKKPRIAKLYRRKDGLPVMAIVEEALSIEEAEAVLALTPCVKQYAPSTFEHRDFYHTDYGGGNDCTYLAGFLQILAPGVAHSVHRSARMVWDAAGWASDGRIFEPADAKYDENGNLHSNYSAAWWPDPLNCGIRTTEHLSYDRWNGLGFHMDGGSDYTVLVALSEPSDYEGGYFSLCPEYDGNSKDSGDCPNKISIKPNKRSAIVFLSNFPHGVEDIRSPGRVMFTNELWRYKDVHVTDRRPSIDDFVLGIDSDDDDKYDKYDGYDDDNNDDDDDDDDAY